MNIGDEEATDHAAAIAYRFNRLFLRTLRQLRYCQLRRDCISRREQFLTRNTLREFPVPTKARKLIHVWRDRKQQPDVREIL